MEELNTQPLDREARLQHLDVWILGLKEKARQRRWYRTHWRAQDEPRTFYIKGTSA